MAKLVVSTTMMSLIDGQKALQVQDGATVRDILHQLITNYPSVKTSIYANDGKLKSNIIIFINDDDIRLRQGIDTVLQKNDTLYISSVIAGG
ncbi:MoaD/ThiS family protein [Paenibacillus woosongensis]|uniref:MoaD/ThiS family protein n=1 Tax=Paenibacillus woosongensis TaxID=307580 RepID=A0A7X2Z0D5_9BACL|nr:MoaD/ThiS family protein [Paenibacillus woosongensis]MUG45294.1 hypothetical protein [Paenibacillus woosongensis]